MYCFSTKQAALRRKIKEQLARNQDNRLSVAKCLFVDWCFQGQPYTIWTPRWSHLLSAVLTVRQHYANLNKRVGIVKRGHLSSLSHCKLTCSRHDIAANFLPLNNKPLTHSLGYKINFMYAMLALAKNKLCTSSLDLDSIWPNTNSDKYDHI